jgi:hypothetical protein
MFGDFNMDGLIPIMIFAIPIVAIVGGITAGIVRTLGQQRLVELAQRERIAAIERGIDPAKLPAMPIISDEEGPVRSYAEYAQRRQHGLMIGGIVTLSVGIGLMAFLLIMNPGEERAWAVGLIPSMVGVALLISSWIVKPKSQDSSTTGMPRS